VILDGKHYLVNGALPHLNLPRVSRPSTPRPRYYYNHEKSIVVDGTSG